MYMYNFAPLCHHLLQHHAIAHNHELPSRQCRFLLHVHHRYPYRDRYSLELTPRPPPHPKRHGRPTGAHDTHAAAEP